MSIQITDGLRQLYCPQINSLNQAAMHGLRSWLLNNNNFIPTTSSDGCLELLLYDPEEYLSCLAKDIDRLSSAAIETVAAIQESPFNKKFLAWQMVELYYAAFYSAHSTLKICGFGLTQIDASIISKLKKQALLFGNTIPDYKAGIYCVDYCKSTRSVKIYKISRYDDSHRGLWQRYSDFLRVLCGTHVRTSSPNSQCIKLRDGSEKAPDSVYSQLPLSDAQVIVQRLEQVCNILNRNGDANWLSFIRNSINYNHQFGLWYPYSGFLGNPADILSKHNRSLYTNNPMIPDFNIGTVSEISDFHKCCHLIISINREIIDDIAIRHPSRKSFLDKGVLQLTRTMK